MMFADDSNAEFERRALDFKLRRSQRIIIHHLPTFDFDLPITTKATPNIKTLLEKKREGEKGRVGAVKTPQD